MIPFRQKSPLPDVTLTKVLLVEGETPSHFFEALAVNLGLDKEIEIRSFGGNESLEARLLATVKMHGFSTTVTSLGIVRDAENDAAAARQSVERILAKAVLPEDMKRNVFILPDNVKPGMIETLCLEAVADKRHFPCVEEFIVSATNLGAEFPSGPKADKSRIQIYMAAHPEPQLYPGIAASRKFWPFEKPLFDKLKEFLRSL